MVKKNQNKAITTKTSWFSTSSINKTQQFGWYEYDTTNGNTNFASYVLYTYTIGFTKNT